MAKDKILKPFLALVSPENKFTVDTISELINAKHFTLGDMVEVLGYHSAGQGRHKRIASATNETFGIQGQNGIWWNIVHEGTIDVSWVGAKNDVVEKQDDYFHMCFNGKVQNVTFSGTYFVENLLFRPETKRLLGVNNAVLKPTQNCSEVLKIRRDSFGGKIKNFKIDGKKPDGTRVAKGIDIHFFQRNSELGDINITNCVIGMTLNEVWSNVFNNIDIIGCGTGIQFNNKKIVGLSEIDGNVNDNLFTRLYIHSCDTGISFDQNIMGLQNSFKQIFFENIETAVYIKNPFQQLTFDGVSVESTTTLIKSEGVDTGSFGEVKMVNFMFIPTSKTEFPFQFLGSGVFSLTLEGFVMAGVTFSDGNYDNFKGILKVTKSRGVITTNVACEFSQPFISKQIKLYHLENCWAVNVYGLVNTAGEAFESPNVQNVKSINLVGASGWNTENKSSITFSGYEGNYEKDMISSFKLRLAKTPGYAIGRPTLSVRKNQTWEDAVVITEKDMLVYDKKVLKQSEFNRYVIDDKGELWLRPTGGWNTESTSALIFDRYYGDYETNAISSFKLRMGKDEEFALGQPTISVRKGESTWHDAFVIRSNDALLYGKQIATTSVHQSLDTPYYALKMQEQGIYEDYVAYRDELFEYENSQVADETMLLPVLQEPVIPESVKAFAEKYKLI